jgi:hypothetical protein
MRHDVEITAPATAVEAALAAERHDFKRVPGRAL